MNRSENVTGSHNGMPWLSRSAWDSASDLFCGDGRLDILFFSRGRGKGHAVPDLAIIHQFRKLWPDTRIVFVSYGSGAEVLATAGESVIDLKLPDMTSFVSLLAPVGTLLSSSRSTLIVSHEEAAVLPIAKIFGLPTVYLTHWFTHPHDPFTQSLLHADEVLFMEREGLFPEPDGIKGRVKYVGPVLRRFRYHPEDRAGVRAEMGILADEKVILMLPGSWTEKMAATRELVLAAFQKVNSPRKRLIWVAGKDCEDLLRFTEGHADVQVAGIDMNLDRLMVASDLAITKGTYCTSRELEALGIPSISLSHGRNFIDDFYARSIKSNSFLWAEETEPVALARCVEAGLDQGLAVPDLKALTGHGAACVAAHLAEILQESSRTEPKSVWLGSDS